MKKLLKLVNVVVIFGLAPLAVAQDLHGQWNGWVKQQGPGDNTSRYEARLTLSGAQGQMDYPSLGCGGSLTFQNKRGGHYYYVERISYGHDKCIDGGMVAVAPSGNSVHWAWNGGGATATGVLSGAISSPAMECARWDRQNDGTYWRICVNDKGHRSCQQKDCESCRAKEVSCS